MADLDDEQFRAITTAMYAQELEMGVQLARLDTDGTISRAVLKLAQSFCEFQNGNMQFAGLLMRIGFNRVCEALDQSAQKEWRGAQIGQSIKPLPPQVQP